jgi:hypothetical protein
LSYLAVILIGMGIAAPLAWLSVEQLYLETQRANLLVQAQLVARSLQTAPESQAAVDPYSQAMNVMPGIHTRVIEEQGAVVIDVQSPAPVEQKAVAPLPQLAQNAVGDVSPEELLSRPEIAEALSGQAATAIRRVAVAGNRRVLYAAAPVVDSDGQATRIVYVASPLPDRSLAALPAAVRWQLAGGIVIAVALAVPETKTRLVLGGQDGEGHPGLFGGARPTPDIECRGRELFRRHLAEVLGPGIPAKGGDVEVDIQPVFELGRIGLGAGAGFTGLAHQRESRQQQYTPGRFCALAHGVSLRRPNLPAGN